MTDEDPNLDAALDNVEESRRAALKRLIGSAAFVAPVVVSFTMADLSVDAFMHAAAANVTTVGTTTTPAPGHPSKS